MRLIHVAADVIGQPVITPGHRIRIVHPLLHDAPLPARREDENVVIELIAILYRGVVDLRRNLAGVDQRLGIASYAVAGRRNLRRSLAGCCAFTTGDDQPCIYITWNQ
jgi:hypothetical protein